MSAPCKTFYSLEVLESNGHPLIESSKNEFSFIFALVSSALAPCSCARCPGGRAEGSVSPVLPVQVGGHLSRTDTVFYKHLDQVPIKMLQSEKFVHDASAETGIMDLNTGIKLCCNITVMEGELYVLSPLILSDCHAVWRFPSYISFTIGFCSFSIPSLS